MKTVVSASRRTDMPACYLDRLAECIRRGCAEVANPYSGKISRVDMDPGRVHTLVLWSKNFGPFLDADGPFRRYRLYFLFTVNDMPGLEPHIPKLAQRLDQARELASRYGSDRIGWRFDPVVFGNGAPVSSPDDFSRIGEAMRSFGVNRAIFSFLDLYGKVKVRDERFSLGLTDPPITIKREYAASIARAAGRIGMTLESCSEEALSVGGITRGACIDGSLLSKLAGEPAPLTKDPGQRAACRCTVSRDIGSYADMPCPHGCLYCYANPIVESDTGAAR